MHACHISGIYITEGLYIIIPIHAAATSMEVM